MVGPEPHQPLDESDLGAERGLGANPRLFEIDLPSRIGDGFAILAAISSVPCVVPSVIEDASDICCRFASCSFFARIALACRIALASLTARKALALDRPGIAIGLADERSSSAISAPRGSASIAAIDP
jgi:hypothetical protein